MSSPAARPSPRGPRGPRAVVAAVVAIVGAGVAVELAMFRSELRQEAERELRVIARQRAAEIERWRSERLSDARVIATNDLVATAVVRARAGSAPDRARLASWSAATAANHDEYDAAVIFGADGEKLVFSGRMDDATPPAEHLERVRRGGGFFLSDFHRHADGEYHVDVVASLPPVGGARSPGYVVLRTDSDVHLVPAMQAWAGRWATAEAVLIQRRGPADAPLVVATGEPAPAVSARREAFPGAAELLAREAGVGEVLDPRGRRILAAASPVPDTPLAVVVHAELGSVYAPLRGRAVLALLLGIALVVAIALGAQLWWRAHRDALRRLEHEEELRRLALERHFAYLTRYANDILLLVDGRLRIVEANDRAMEAYGRTRDELLGLPVRELLAPRARAGFDERVRAIAVGCGEVFETEHVRRDGTPFPVEVSSRMIELDGERYHQSIIRDITQRKVAQRALRASDERLRLALEASGLGVWDWTASGDVFASETLLRMLGHGPGALEDPAATLGRVVHPEDWAVLAPRFEALTRGQVAELAMELRVRTSAGRWKRVHTRTRVLRRDQAGAALRLAGTVSELPEPAQERPDLVA